MLLVAAGTAAGAAITAGPVSGGVVSACYKTAASNGSHAVVLESAGTRCASGIVTVTPIGPIGSAGAQAYGWSGTTLLVNTSGSQGEYAFTAFPGS